MRKIIYILLAFARVALAGNGDNPHTKVIVLPNFTASQCAKPDPYPIYPFTNYPGCYNAVGQNDYYALFNALDTALYYASNKTLIISTPGCSNPLPNPYYPYDSLCNWTVGNYDIYACYYVIKKLDSVLKASGGGGGNCNSGTAGHLGVFANDSCLDNSYAFQNSPSAGAFRIVTPGSTTLNLIPANKLFSMGYSSTNFIEGEAGFGFTIKDSLGLFVKCAIPTAGGTDSVLLRNASTGRITALSQSSFGNISGSLTAGYVPYAISSNTIGNSVLYYNGTNVGIGTNTPAFPLTINAPNSRGILIYSSATGEFTTSIENDAAGNGLFYQQSNGNIITNYITSNGSSFFGGGNITIGESDSVFGNLFNVVAAPDKGILLFSKTTGNFTMALFNDANNNGMFEQQNNSNVLTNFLTGNGASYFSAGSINIGTKDTTASTAILRVESTTQGVIFCPMTTVQRTAISSPTEGTIVYDLTLHAYYYWNGSAWITPL